MFKQDKRRRATPQRESRPQAGFTLIEVITTVGILSILFILVVGIFSRFIFVQNRTISEQTIQEDLQFSLELFNREARTGYGSTYEAVQDDFLAYRNQNRVCVAYRLNDGVLERAEADPAFPETAPCAGAGYDGQFQALTSPETTVENIIFQVQVADGQQQGFISMLIGAHSQHKPDNPITLQNTVTSRQVIPFTPNQ